MLKNEQGFAMVEVLILTAVVAILTSIALPKVNSILQEIYVDHETINMYSDLKYAQSSARITNYQRGIMGVYNGNGNFFRLRLSDNRYYLVYNGKIKYDNPLSYDFSLKNRNISQYVRFTHLGLVEKSGTIKLKNPSFLRTIIINEAGRIRIDRN